MEPKANLVTISLEEYMDLREKAAMNGFLMTELGNFRSEIMEMHRRMGELERRLMDVEAAE